MAAPPNFKDGDQGITRHHYPGLQAPLGDEEAPPKCHFLHPEERQQVSPAATHKPRRLIAARGLKFL